MAQGKVLNPAQKELLEKDDIWHMSQGTRNRYFAEKFDSNAAKKQNNLAKPTPPID